MKKILLGFLAFLTLLFVAPLSPKADAQVSVRVGHRHHHRRAYYRHGHRYYR